MRKLSSAEMALAERLATVLEMANPTTEELTITLEITPEDVLERFPDRIYDLREKIVDTHVVFGDPDEEITDEENFLNYEEADDWEEDPEEEGGSKEEE